ncbi:phasin family protein [Erythrobacter litoralis]|nr:phasin family protein [Erythrobacter litoralis]
MAESQNKSGKFQKRNSKSADSQSGDTVDLKSIAAAVEAKTSAPAEAEKVAEAVDSTPDAGSSESFDTVNAQATLAETPEPKKATRPAKKPVNAKPSAKKSVSKKKVVRTATSDRAPTPPIETKESVMENVNQQNAEQIADKTKEMASDMQNRMTSAYEKSSEMTSEAVEFQKGNVEAMVESSRILVSGMQNMGRTYVEEARSAAEAMQDDVKKMAAIKSPTELFQLQGEIARRNFDAMVATASKNTEAMMKLANDAFAPMSNRMSLAAEKVSKAA